MILAKTDSIKLKPYIQVSSLMRKQAFTVILNLDFSMVDGSRLTVIGTSLMKKLLLHKQRLISSILM